MADGKNSDDADASTPSTGDANGSPTRRKVLGGLVSAVGGGLVLAVGGISARYACSPIGRRTVSSADAPIDVGSFEALEVGAPPTRLAVVAPVLRDGWAQQSGVALGAAWVRRLAGDKLEALSSVCPHLGCAIGWDAAKEQFNCPCHDSAFDPRGARVYGPSPRDMDPLPIAVERGRLRLTWVRYRQGVGAREVL